MADLDTALNEALSFLEPHRPQPAIGVPPGGLLPGVRAELADIERVDPDSPIVPDDDDEEDFTHDGRAGSGDGQTSDAAASVVNEVGAARVTGDHPTG